MTPATTRARPSDVYSKPTTQSPSQFTVKHRFYSLTQYNHRRMLSELKILADLRFLTWKRVANGYERTLLLIFLGLVAIRFGTKTFHFAINDTDRN